MTSLYSAPLPRRDKTLALASGEPFGPFTVWFWRMVFPVTNVVYWYYYNDCKSVTLSNIYRENTYGVVLLYWLLTAIAVYNIVQYLEAYFGHQKLRLQAAAKDQDTRPTTSSSNGSVNAVVASGHTPESLDHLKWQYLSTFILSTLMKLLVWTAIFWNHTGFTSVCRISPTRFFALFGSFSRL
jgi:hypothetical protein